MKKLLLICFLLLCNSHIFAQTKKLSLHLLKETNEIDSMINIVIKKSRTPDIYFSFTTVHTPIGYEFTILRLEKTKKNIYYRVHQFSEINDWGYFKVDGYTVFVSGDDPAPQYFKTTSGSEKFETILLKDTVNYFSADSLFKNDPEHRHGKFFFVSRGYGDKK